MSRSQHVNTQGGLSGRIFTHHYYACYSCYSILIFFPVNIQLITTVKLLELLLLVISPLLLLQPPHLTSSKIFRQICTTVSWEEHKVTNQDSKALISLNFFTGCMVRGQVTILLCGDLLFVWWYHSLATVLF